MVFLVSLVGLFVTRVTLVVFRLVSTGLFTQHQLMFAFALYTNILRTNHQHRLIPSNDRKTGSLPEVDSGFLSGADEISEEEWFVFLQGNAHEVITGGGGGGESINGWAMMFLMLLQNILSFY